MKFKEYIKQPYPISEKKWNTVIFIGLFVSLFMLIIQPFGTASISTPYKYYILLGFGAVSTIVVAFNLFLIEPLFRKIINIKEWTIGKAFVWELWLVFTIGVANYVYDLAITQNPFKWDYFFRYQFHTLTLGIIIVIIHIGFSYKHLLNKYLQQAKEINKDILLAKLPRKESQTNVVSLVADNNKTSVEIELNNLIAIESVANYVQIYHLQNNVLQTTILRSSLKKVEEALSSYPEIMRCHRAFLVNLKNILEVSGNSQGLLLSLKAMDMPIPVSRSYTKQLKDILQ